MSATAMLIQRVFLLLGVITMVSSCIIVFKNLFTGRYYDVDYRPPHQQPKHLVRHPEIRNIPKQRAISNANHRRR